MSRTRKEKLETYTDASLLVSEDSEEENAFTVADDYIEAALERKKEANKPIYLKRI